MNSIMYASEPLTTKEFFALDVDDKLKVELIGGALTVSPSPRQWHGDVAFELALALRSALGRPFKVFLDLDVTIDDETVPRPDIFVVRREDSAPDKVAQAHEVLLAIEVMSPGSRINDRRVKPELYRKAGIPSWRIERDEKRLVLIEIPVDGEERTCRGSATLKVADIDVPIDLDAIAADIFGT